MSAFAFSILPLLVTIYFAITRRSPVAGTLTGALIGVCQDALTHRPIGVNGIAKAMIGYPGGFDRGPRSIRRTTEPGCYLILVFTLLHSSMYLLITHRLLGWMCDGAGCTSLSGAVADSLVGCSLFALLDRAKRRE